MFIESGNGWELYSFGSLLCTTYFSKHNLNVLCWKCKFIRETWIKCQLCWFRSSIIGNHTLDRPLYVSKEFNSTRNSLFLTFLISFI